VRDLAVDRQFMFESLKRVKAWIPIDGTYDLGEGPRMAPETQEKAYKLSTCISCGSCLEVCPQVNGTTPGGFVGAAIVSQVRLFNMHPTGAMHAHERINALMQPGGIQDCSNAQNCVNACPKEIPLTESLAEINRQAWKQAMLGWLIG
jgi:succinate dehydrogenase / fumarate reductase iron-sulfur subunit